MARFIRYLVNRPRYFRFIDARDGLVPGLRTTGLSGAAVLARPERKVMVPLASAGLKRITPRQERVRSIHRDGIVSRIPSSVVEFTLCDATHVLTAT